MKKSLKKVELTFLKRVSNVRLKVNEDINGDILVPDIIEKGLVTEIWATDDGEILQGHTRFSAIKRIKSEYPEEYERLFGKGIPALVYAGLTDTEKIKLKLDHGDKKTLTDPFELQQSANMVLGDGGTESDLAHILANVLDTVKPMLPAKQLEMRALRKGDSKEFHKRYQLYRRGVCQQLTRAYQCPHVVMALLEWYATGIKPNLIRGIKDEKLPKSLTTNDVKMLWESHNKDRDESSDWTKKIPGPIFRAKLLKIVERTRKVTSTKAKPKCFSGQQLKDSVETVASRGMKQLLTAVQDGRDAKVLHTRIGEYDTLLLMAELVSTEDKKWYDEVFVPKYTSLRETKDKRLDEEAKATAEAAVTA